MASTRISELPNAGDLQADDVLVILRDGITQKATYELPTGGGGGGGGLASIATDSTLVGAGTSVDRLRVAIPFTQGEKDKLAALPTSYTAPVQSDWQASSGLAAILNKPTLPTSAQLVPSGGGAGQVLKRQQDGSLGWSDDEVGSPGSGEANVQADWNVTNDSSDAYIKNKPSIPTNSDIDGRVNAIVPGVFRDGNTDEIAAAKIPLATETTRGGITHALFTRLSGLNDIGVMAKSAKANVRLRTGSATNLTPDSQKRIYGTTANFASGAWWRDNSILHGWIQSEGANLGGGLPTGQNFLLYTALDATNDIHQWAFPDDPTYYWTRRWNYNANPPDWTHFAGTLTGTAAPASTLGNTGSFYARTNTSVPTFYIKRGSTWSQYHPFTNAEQQKLSNIEAMAEVNVKPDWNAASGADNEILNKPTIPTETPQNRLLPAGGSDGQVLKKTSAANYAVAWEDDATGTAGSGEENVQADWNETLTTSDAYIKNKPDIPTSAQIAAAATYKGVWSASATYSEGNIVRTGAVRYWILAGGADSTNENPGNEASRWLALNNYYGGWSSGDAPYAVGQIVTNSGNVYINTWSNNSDEPGSSSGNGPRWINLSAAGGGEANVQSDWNVTDSQSDAFIKNKPTIPTIDADYVEDEIRLLNTATLEDGGVIWTGTYKEATLTRGTQATPARGMERSEFNGNTAGSTDTDTTALPVSKLTGRQSDGDSFVSAFFWHDGNINLALGNDGGAGLGSHFIANLRVALVINGNKVWDEALGSATATSGAGGGDTRFQWARGADPFPAKAGREFRLLFYSASAARGLKFLYQHAALTGLEVKTLIGGLSGDDRIDINAFKGYQPSPVAAANRETLVNQSQTSGDNPSFTGRQTDSFPATWNLSRTLAEADDEKLMVIGLKFAVNATDRDGTWAYAAVYAGDWRAASNAPASAANSLDSVPADGLKISLWSVTDHDSWIRGVLYKTGDQSYGVTTIQNGNADAVFISAVKIYLQPHGGASHVIGEGLDAQEQADFDALSTGLFKVNTTRRATFNITAAASGTKVGWGNAANGNYGSIDQSNIDGERVSTNNALANVDIPVLEIYSEPDSNPTTNEVVIKVSPAHASALQGNWITGLRMFILNATTGAKVLDVSPASFIDLTAANTDKLISATQANEKFIAGSKYIVGFYKSATSTDVLTAEQILTNGNYDLGVRSKGIISFYKRGSSSSSAPGGKPLLPSIGIPPNVFFGLNGWQIPLIEGVNQSASQIDNASERWYSLAALPVSDGYLWRMTAPYEIDSTTGRVRLVGTRWMRDRLTHAAHVDY